VIAPFAIVVVFPVDVTIPVKFAFVVTVPAFPVTLATIGLVTVRLPNVPTEVNDELTIAGFNVVPVKAAALAAVLIVISDEPSKATPFIFFGAASFVAVPAFPVIAPAIGAVTVNPVKVPTEVMAG
jgi:hypothetical protein